MTDAHTSYDYSCLTPDALKDFPSHAGLLWSHANTTASGVGHSQGNWLGLFSRFPLDGPAWQPTRQPPQPTSMAMAAGDPAGSGAFV